MTRKPALKRTPLPAHSERLWAELQSNLIDFTKTLVQIIEVEAWKPTYDSFFDAWDAKMSSITFAPELRPFIAYQMFNEGHTPDEVADAIKGISPESATRLKEQKDIGITADEATTIVRRHNRKLPHREFRWLRLKIDIDTLREWRRIADGTERTVNEITYEAAQAAFTKLAKQTKR